MVVTTTRDHGQNHAAQIRPALVMYPMEGFPRWGTVLIVVAMTALGLLGAWRGRGRIARGERETSFVWPCWCLRPW